MNAFSCEELMQCYRSNVFTSFSLAIEAFEGVQKLAGLNLHAGRSVLSEGTARLQDINPDAAGAGWLASPLRLAESAVAKTLSYQQHVHDIVVTTHSASAKIIDVYCDQFSRDPLARIGNWAKHAPAGSETPAAVTMKSALSTASGTAETVRKSVQSVVEVAQANVSAMLTGASENAASQSNERARKT
ncbi:phasin family protein [Paraburkholderia caledonica]|uniref:phasin family protein n=1 Tax=Paraburkholderia caledonica TaxID=134536 RepID=UPI0038BA2F44